MYLLRVTVSIKRSDLHETLGLSLTPKRYVNVAIYIPIIYTEHYLLFHK